MSEEIVMPHVLSELGSKVLLDGLAYVESPR
jgi:hypothetical protein